MKNLESVLMKGQFSICHKDRNGKVLSEEVFDNTITTTGKAQVARLFDGDSTNIFKWIGLGSSSTTATAANTDLITAITAAGLTRAACTVTQATTTTAGDTAQLVHTFTATASQAVREAGIFSTATSGGVMACRQTFTAKNMENGETLAVTYRVKFA